MIEFDLKSYQASDSLCLWWLVNPEVPRLIGELRIARALKGVSLVYAPAWLKSGFALSEDLPLVAGELLPREKETAAGAVDDARPDRWGERLIRFLDKPPRLSVLDFLFYAGDERFGALGISVSARHLITPGTTLGGARPKALLDLKGRQWVLKFNEPGELNDMSLVEHATMTLSGHAGIRAAQTLSVRVRHGHAVAVKRFDREQGMRRHALSANDNALSQCELFGLDKAEAKEQVREVCKVVDGWRKHFARAQVSRADIESLAGQIDRPFLLDQRRAFI